MLEKPIISTFIALLLTFLYFGKIIVFQKDVCWLYITGISKLGGEERLGGSLLNFTILQGCKVYIIFTIFIICKVLQGCKYGSILNLLQLGGFKHVRNAGNDVKG